MNKPETQSAVGSTRLLAAPREFFVEVDSLLSWIANRGWVIRDPEDREIAEKLIRQARGIYQANSMISPKSGNNSNPTIGT